MPALSGNSKPTMSNSGTTAAKASFLILALSLLGLLLGIIWVFQLTFQPGSIYPPYSTLRSDPLGSKLFYHSLADLSGSEVRRSHLPLTQAEIGTEPGIFFFLGIKEEDLEKISVAEAEAMEKWLEQGWRLVFALKPGHPGDEEKQEKEEKAKDKILIKPSPDKETLEKKSADNSLDYYPDRRVRKIRREKELESSYFKTVSLLNRWDLALETLPFPERDELEKPVTQKKGVTGHVIPLPAVEGRRIEGTLPLFSEKVVSFYSKAWQPVFLRDLNPVALERKMGRGSVVFITDSYAFSNQSLAKGPALGVIEWCLDGRTLFVFDEYHHGLAASPGVMSLARTLRLEGLFAGLLILSLLLIWRASRSFPPLPDTEQIRNETEGTAAPRDQLDGLSNLLQRGLPPKELISACLAEWQKSGSRRDVIDISAFLPADGAVQDKKQPRILETFHQLHQHLHKKTPL